MNAFRNRIYKTAVSLIKARAAAEVAVDVLVSYLQKKGTNIRMQTFQWNDNSHKCGI